MLQDILGLAMFGSAFALLLTGFPVAFALAGCALVFFAIGMATGAMNYAFLQAFPQRIYGIMTNDVLVAIPLFVLMGVVLERSRVAEELIDTCARLFGAVRGGLGLSIFIVGALLAATTGVVGATVVTMGLMALPPMLRHGYSRSLASGSVAAAGTLGQIIPPSIVLVVLGDQLGTAYQSAQLALGNFAPETVSVGDLFAGAVVPGLLLVFLYVLYQVLVAWLRPELSPALPPEERSLGPSPLATLLRAVAPTVVLIVAVLGSILGGVATPTEAAAVGAVGAILVAADRRGGRSALVARLTAAAFVALLVLTGLVDLRLGREAVTAGQSAGILVATALCALVAAGLLHALRQLAREGLLRTIARNTTDVTAMIFAILIGATLFSLVFRGLGGEDLVRKALSSMPGGPGGAVLLVMAVMFLLGFFLDFLEIVFVVVPIVAPALLQMEGIDPIWLGVMMAVNLQTSFLTPPFGPTLFYLRGVAPPEVTTGDIYRGIVPFVAIQLAVLVLLWLFPALATALPRALYG